MMRSSDRSVPLAVDLDGTLAKSDGLIDALLTISFKKPRHLPAVLAAAVLGPLALKEKMVALDAYRPESMPLRQDLVDYLRAQAAAGRSVYLVTATPQAIAERVASRLGFFAGVIGSTAGTNLKGAAKADELDRRFPDGFAYAGSDATDLPVWRRSAAAVAVAASPSVTRELYRLDIPIESRIGLPAGGVGAWLRLLRWHQWVKNVLLFVPLVLAHEYGNVAAVAGVAAGALCCCLVASATYIINDLSDLDADRRHRTKRDRPLASGEIGVPAAIAVAGGLGLAGLMVASLLGLKFILCVLFYIVLTVSYSIRLKAVPLLDIFILGLLYSLRIVMGMVLVGGVGSPWLIVFSLFFFFSLSTAKRHVEIVRAVDAGETGKIRGRGYFTTDAPLTLSLGLTTAGMAALLMLMYVANDAHPAGAYRHPQWLWGIGPLVFLWTCRIWLKSHRGRMDDDPVVFAIRDLPSLLLGCAVSALFVLATL